MQCPVSSIDKMGTTKFAPQHLINIFNIYSYMINIVINVSAIHGRLTRKSSAGDRYIHILLELQTTITTITILWFSAMEFPT